RSFDEYAGHEVTAAPAIEDAHTRTPVAQGFARLDTGRDLDLDPRSVDSGKSDCATQSGSREADGRLRDQRRPFPAENGVTLHGHKQVEVARPRATDPCLAFASHPDPRSVVHTRGDIDV